MPRHLVVYPTLATLLLIGGLTGCRLPESGSTLYAPQVWESGSGSSPAPMVRRAEAAGTETIFTDAREWNLPGREVSLNSAARMLAGVPADSERDGFAAVRRTSAWRAHQAAMDQLWKDYEWRHEVPIRQWAAREMSDLAGSSTLFYPFSGPDFLFAQAFFPRAETLILCGLEPAEALPIMKNLSADEVTAGLENLRTALSTVMQFSFFITKDMRNDLQSSRFRGVLPVLMVFLVRSGHTIDTVDAIRIGAGGNPLITPIESGSAPGLMIRARSPQGTMRRVFYLRQNLADDSLSRTSPFLAFVRESAPGVAFTKSASYLMHENNFSTIRSFLLEEFRGLVQDSSGIPYRMFEPAGWNLQLFGNYQRTLDMFGAKCQQPDLAAAYAQGRHQARPLPFGIGYLYQPGNTCLMVGRR